MTPARRSSRRLSRIVLGLLAAVLLLGSGAVVWLATTDLRALAERYASEALGRPVTIGSLRIGWSSPLAVELDDLRLANMASGSAPEMLRIARLSARLDLSSLLRGALRFEKLTLEKPALLLERDDAGNVNWRIKRSDAPSLFHIAVIPRNRTEFPTLIDFVLRDGALIYRAAGNQDLRVAFQRLAIGAADDAQAVTLDVDGAYDDTPVQLSGKTDSFSVLRDRAVPFGTLFALVTKSGTLGFKGTMTEPLDLDGIEGRLTIAAPKLGDLLTTFGAAFHADVPLSIAGRLTTSGVHWLITEATGKLAQDPFDGSFDLAETPPGHADEIVGALNFARLDLKRLLAGDGDAGGVVTPDADIFSFQLDKKPGANVDARIGATQLVYGGTRLANVKAEARLASEEIRLRALSFGFANGKVDLSGDVRTTAGGNHIVADAALSAADIAQLAGLAGLGSDQIAGQIDGHLTLDVTGATQKAAFKTSRGQAVLAMRDGRVARDLIEKASTDLRTIFRKGEGSVPVTCLLGVVELQNGLATIAPLRLRTPDTTLIGGGSADLAAARLDLTIKAEGGSPSIFALQVPIRISGSLDKPSIAPAIGASAAWLDAPARNDAIRKLAPALEPLAARNACRQ
ncbi:MAG: AsmA family protein [Pseudomonadota bacterium]